VLIVDPWEVIRQGLGAMLSCTPDSESWCGLATVAELVDTATPGDVALLSTAAIDRMDIDQVAQPPFIYTIVLMSSYEVRDIELATTVRANGYMSMADVTSDSLRRALTQVRQDTMAMPREVSSFLLRRARGDDPLSVWRSIRLTPREQDVLDLLVHGCSNKEIAARLGISLHGAKRHVSSLLTKLDSPSRTHLVSAALQAGVVRNGHDS
jgi:two-component system, NarL family, nitrate/nitrite response regulator NarL